MKPALLIIAIAISFFMNSMSWAYPVSERDAESVTTVKTSESGPHGAALSLLGDPGLSVIGINYLYSITDSTRFRAGFGTLFDLGWTIGTGLDFRLPTGSRFRPVAGLEIDLTRIRDRTWSLKSDDSQPWGFSFEQNDRNYNVLYSTLKIGVEYQAPAGFLVGLTAMGLCGIALETSGAGCALNPIPSLRIGTMF